MQDVYDTVAYYKVSHVTISFDKVCYDTPEALLSKPIKSFPYFAL